MLLPDKLQEAVHEGGMHVCLGLLLPRRTVYLICSTADGQCLACKRHCDKRRLCDGRDEQGWEREIWDMIQGVEVGP